MATLHLEHQTPDIRQAATDLPTSSLCRGHISRPVLCALGVIVGVMMVTACGDTAPDTTGAPSVTSGIDLTNETSETAVTNDLRQFASMERFEQQIPPDDPAVTGKLTGVIVPERIEDVWPTWGPFQRPALDPPDVTGQVVVIWDGGHSLEVTGYRVAGTELVVHGIRHLPGPNCVTPDDIGGVTIVATVDDPDVQPGMAGGDPVIESRITDCG